MVVALKVHFQPKGDCQMNVQTIEDLFVEQIQDLYDAEQRLVKALPKMAEASTNRELRSAFEDHVEHYEIAGYGTARTLATSLGLNQSPRLLEQTLDEEKKADAKLTQIAEQTVNQQAMRPKT